MVDILSPENKNAPIRRRGSPKFQSRVAWCVNVATARLANTVGVCAPVVGTHPRISRIRWCINRSLGVSPVSSYPRRRSAGRAARQDIKERPNKRRQRCKCAPRGMTTTSTRTTRAAEGARHRDAIRTWNNKVMTSPADRKPAKCMHARHRGISDCVVGLTADSLTAPVSHRRRVCAPEPPTARSPYTSVSVSGHSAGRRLSLCVQPAVYKFIAQHSGGAVLHSREMPDRRRRLDPDVCLGFRPSIGHPHTPPTAAGRKFHRMSVNSDIGMVFFFLFNIILFDFKKCSLYSYNSRYSSLIKKKYI